MDESRQWTDEEMNTFMMEAMSEAYGHGVIVPFSPQSDDTPDDTPLEGIQTSDGRYLYVCDACSHAVWIPPCKHDPIRKCENCKERSIFTRQQVNEQPTF